MDDTGFGVPTENLNNCVKSNFLVVYSGQMPHSGDGGVTLANGVIVMLQSGF